MHHTMSLLVCGRYIGVSRSDASHVHCPQACLPQQSRYATRYDLPLSGLTHVPIHAVGEGIEPAGQLWMPPPQHVQRCPSTAQYRQ